MDKIISIKLSPTSSTETDGLVNGILYLFNKPYWATKTGAMFEWSWIDLLEHLVLNWQRLYLERVYPIPITKVSHPGKFLNEAEKRWKDFSLEERDEEERKVFSFLLAHNLSEGMADAELPALIIMRDNDSDLAWVVDVYNNATKVPFTQLINDILEVGNNIADSYDGSTVEHVQNLIKQWKS